MAGTLYSAEVGAAVALVAATAKTVLSVIAPAQFGVDLRKYRISFDGVTASAVPVLCELVSWTTDGTGTSGTVVQTSGRAVTAGFTTKYNYSAEPSTPTLIERFTLSPNGGTVIYDFPYGDSPDTAVSQLIGIRLTAPAIVNANCTMWFSRC